MTWRAGAAMILAGLVGGCDVESPESAVAREFQRAQRVHPAPVITQADLRKLTATEGTTGILLVDTRTTAEYAVSHLPGALSWPDYASGPLPTAITDHRARGGQVVFYCSIGYRSGEACLRAQSLTKGTTSGLLNLEGGIFQWANEAGPLQGGTQVHGYDSRWEQLLRPELRAQRHSQASPDSNSK